MLVLKFALMYLAAQSGCSGKMVKMLCGYEHSRTNKKFHSNCRRGRVAAVLYGNTCRFWWEVQNSNAANV